MDRKGLDLTKWRNGYRNRMINCIKSFKGKLQTSLFFFFFCSINWIIYLVYILFIYNISAVYLLILFNL